MALDEIREQLKNAKDALNRSPSDTHAQQGYVRNLIALLEIDLKIAEIEKTDTAIGKLVEIVQAVGSTSDNLKKATENIEKTSKAQEKQTNAIIFWTAGLFFATFVMAVIGYFQMQEAQKLTKITQEQIKNAQNATYMEYIFKFNEQFSQPTNQAIALAIEDGRKVLKVNGGVFSDDDLDSYLDIYEDIAKALQMNLISKDLFYNDFSDNLSMVYDNRKSTII